MYLQPLVYTHVISSSMHETGSSMCKFVLIDRSRSRTRGRKTPQQSDTQKYTDTQITFQTSCHESLSSTCLPLWSVSVRKWVSMLHSTQTLTSKMRVNTKRNNHFTKARLFELLHSYINTCLLRKSANNRCLSRSLINLATQVH